MFVSHTIMYKPIARLMLIRKSATYAIWLRSKYGPIINTRELNGHVFDASLPVDLVFIDKNNVHNVRIVEDQNGRDEPAEIGKRTRVLLEWHFFVRVVIVVGIAGFDRIKLDVFIELNIFVDLTLANNRRV
jgi:hypothetical protein